MQAAYALQRGPAKAHVWVREGGRPGGSKSLGHETTVKSDIFMGFGRIRDLISLNSGMIILIINM